MDLLEFEINTNYLKGLTTLTDSGAWCITALSAAVSD
jgi:hypothetical protein